MSNGNNMPVIEYRSGKISLAVFENKRQTDHGEVTDYSLKLDKSFKDKEGNWKTTNYYFPDELLKVARLCEYAFAQLSIKERVPQQGGN